MINEFHLLLTTSIWKSLLLSKLFCAKQFMSDSLPIKVDKALHILSISPHSTTNPFILSSTNSLTPLNSNVPIKFYLGLINSRAFNYYCDYFSYTNHITVSGIKQTPIPQATTSQVQEMIELVDKILEIKCSDTSADTSALEREIDGLVYGLYGLTEEEVEVIEKGN